MQAPFVTLVVASAATQDAITKVLPVDEHWQILQVDSSLCAISILKQRPVQLIVAEIETGDIDSWRLARLVRANVLQCGEHTPFVLLSSTYSERITETTARAYGIDLVLPLPQLAQLPALVQKFSAQTPQARGRPRLLVVEDDSDIAELARRILQSSYEIEIATSGTQALALYQPDKYALVLLDVMLPGLNGQQVLHDIIRQQPQQSVVVMTAHGGIDIAESMMLQGAADFISKPFRADQLRRVIEVAAQREDFMVSNQQFRQKVEQLAGSEARYRALSQTHQRVLDHVSTVLMELDVAGHIRFANRAWFSLSGQSTAPEGQLFSQYLQKADQPRFAEQLQALTEGGASQWRFELQLAQPPCWVALHMIALPDRASGVALTLENIDERKKAEQELQHLALHDTLTGLYNRYFFDRELNRLAQQAHGKDASHALLYIDLDHFKVINDSHGHSQGDAILREVSLRLASQLAPEDVLCRVGGDEFVVLSADKSLEKAELLGQRLCQQLQQNHYQLNDKVYTVSCSIGVSLIDGSSRDAQLYLQQADIALYVAKDKGRNRVHCYSGSDQASDELKNSLQWAQQLREAIVHDQITLHFQPVVEVKTGAVAYFEALVRLCLPDRLVYPGEFITALERVEDISLLDHQVIGKAIAMMSEHPLLRKVAINLSAQAFRDERLVPLIAQKLAQYQVDAGRIVFELTETASLSNIAGTSAMISELTALGCEFSIDDFGTGFSTFSYLKQLPASSIKIDGSFVKDMHQDQIDYALVKSMAEIARVLGRKSVAEFVENAEILQLLAELGVDYAQGYHISKPMPIEQLKNYC